jgi:hypothetical protein
VSTGESPTAQWYLDPRIAWRSIGYPSEYEW